MRFLKENVRFDFLYGGKPFLEQLCEKKTEQNGEELITTYCLSEGLQVKNIARKYEKYGVYEWVNYFENTSDALTKTVSDLFDCDCLFPMKREEEIREKAYLTDREKGMKIYAPTGSDHSKKEFYTHVDETYHDKRINHIQEGERKKYASFGGRSSQKNAPFFNVCQNGRGYIFAVGWTGQWNVELSRTQQGVRFCSGIENVCFKMLPKEKFRTSSVVVMPYEGDFVEAQNKWRRFLKEQYSPVGKGERDRFLPFCAGVWGGMKTSSVLDRIKRIKEYNLPFEYIWMDAGWYGKDTVSTPDEYEGDWWDKVGDWRVSSLIHPNGLKDVAKEIENAGLKFLLWFEPERARKSAPIACEHPEYFLTGENENDKNLLLNLGDPQAWEYAFSAVCEKISALDVRFYRQDFNMDPLTFWRKHDEEDRKGITEIKHINGLYRFWDGLLEKFPYLLIDNCASGGRRIDVESLKRSVPLWRSDDQCSANYDVESAQSHHLSFSSWLPYSGTGSGRVYDEYRIRSAYGSSMLTNYSFSERNDFCVCSEQVEFLRKYGEEYLKARPYFSEDFYPLTEFSDRLDSWSAAQFHRPNQGDGILQVFKREKSLYETARFFLRGLCKTKRYRFCDADGGEWEVNGADLIERGLLITVQEQRKAKLYFYSELEESQENGR